MAGKQQNKIFCCIGIISSILQSGYAIVDISNFNSKFKDCIKGIWIMVTVKSVITHL